MVGEVGLVRHSPSSQSQYSEYVWRRRKALEDSAHVPFGYFNRSVRPSFAICYLLFVMRFARGFA